jgi:hypothetical protein
VPRCPLSRALGVATLMAAHRPPRPDPELPRPAARVPRDALQGTLGAPAPPRSTYDTPGPECLPVPAPLDHPPPPPLFRQTHHLKVKGRRRSIHRVRARSGVTDHAHHPHNTVRFIQQPQHPERCRSSTPTPRQTHSLNVHNGGSWARSGDRRCITLCGRTNRGRRDTSATRQERPSWRWASAAASSWAASKSRLLHQSV